MYRINSSTTSTAMHSIPTHSSGRRMQKPFAAGVRIEHSREFINRAQYGDFAENSALWAAEYQLSHHVGERCAYTFCMCPGGYVVPSADREDAIVTNGMSCFARDGKNANSALVCSVSAEDFGGDPFKAMAFQHEIEGKAFEMGGGTKAPAQTVGAFLNGGVSRFGKVEPTYARGVDDKKLADLFPEEIISVLMAHPDMFKILTDFSEDDMISPINKRIFSAVKDASLKGDGRFDISLCGDDFSPEEMGYIASLQNGKGPFANPKQSIEDAVQVLKNEKTNAPPGEAGKLADDEWARQMQKMIEGKKRSN